MWHPRTWGRSRDAVTHKLAVIAILRCIGDRSRSAGHAARAGDACEFSRGLATSCRVPAILLEIAQALRELGRLADAANTYQRYLGDPEARPERVAEIKDLAQQLDTQLTTLTVRVSPHASELSIDAGPFVLVGTSLTTRVRPGPHLIRIRSGAAVDELGIVGFEGEAKDVSLVVRVADSARSVAAAPDHVDGWLVDGTQYAAAGRRTSRCAPDSPRARGQCRVIVPHEAPASPREEDVDASAVSEPDHVTSGVEALLRIDGKGRGFAGGLGLAYAASDELELEVAGLRSDIWGAYAGVRYRFLAGGSLRCIRTPRSGSRCSSSPTIAELRLRPSARGSPAGSS